MERNKFKIFKVEKDVWFKDFHENSHLAVFGEKVEKDRTRMDYALIATNQNDEMIVYSTIHEADKHIAFLEYGGSFPNKRGSEESFPAFQAMLSYLKDQGYERANFFTENKNYAMLKFGMKAGFKIVGICYSNGKILLENTLPFKGE